MNSSFLTSNGNQTVLRFIDVLEPGFGSENILPVYLQPFTADWTKENPRVCAVRVDLPENEALALK